MARIETMIAKYYEKFKNTECLQNLAIVSTEDHLNQIILTPFSKL